MSHSCGLFSHKTPGGDGRLEDVLVHCDRRCRSYGVEDLLFPFQLEVGRVPRLPLEKSIWPNLGGVDPGSQRLDDRQLVIGQLDARGEPQVRTALWQNSDYSTS